MEKIILNFIFDFSTLNKLDKIVLFFIFLIILIFSIYSLINNLLISIKVWERKNFYFSDFLRILKIKFYLILVYMYFNEFKKISFYLKENFLDSLFKKGENEIEIENLKKLKNILERNSSLKMKELVFLKDYKDSLIVFFDLKIKEKLFSFGNIIYFFLIYVLNFSIKGEKDIWKITNIVIDNVFKEKISILKDEKFSIFIEKVKETNTLDKLLKTIEALNFALLDIQEFFKNKNIEEFNSILNLKKEDFNLFDFSSREVWIYIEFLDEIF